MINISRDIRLSLGRSMIEMLGVLTIIGVLSIGGLYAYRQAMNRHQTNQLIDLLNRVHIAFIERCFFSEECAFGYWDNGTYNISLLCSYGADLCSRKLPYFPDLELNSACGNDICSTEIKPINSQTCKEITTTN